MEVKVNNTIIRLIQGDITVQRTAAVVNAANSSLLGGGGVDGAIHRAGGSQVLEECKKIRSEKGKCSAGEAVITSGGNLYANSVIHTVGPVWSGGNKNEQEVLARAYWNCLSLAKEKGIYSISFPSISTGAYGFPIEKASEIAVNTVRKFVEENSGIDEIQFVLFSGPDFKVYENAMQKLPGE